MSKTVIIIRHAKTEPYSEGGDKSRDLTARGIQDAEKKVHLWQQKKYAQPGAILYSSANRTTQTKNIFQQAFRLPEEKCIAMESIYYAGPEELDAIISKFEDESVSCLAIIGHNNTLTDYLNHKISHFSLDNLPTSGFVGFELPVRSWKDNAFHIRGAHLFHEIIR